jgi:hypothetical protein
VAENVGAADVVSDSEPALTVPVVVAVAAKADAGKASAAAATRITPRRNGVLCMNFSFLAAGCAAAN